MTEEEARAEARARVEDGDFVSAILERIGSGAGVKAVFGEAVEGEGVTVIPVARVRWGGGGGGGGEGADEGFGGGGGAMAAPHGFIELSGGEARYRRVRSPARVPLLALCVALAGVAVAVLLKRLEA
jgi:uncharacterized spore protein YtfJ